ncbi:MAG: adenylate/guanylate cyclase domain-containing protein [Betaproteobacteria bacterium]|nr:adenylate/guanylate cyclase domain-containing protein [Betaproteobacteria bacterium]
MPEQKTRMAVLFADVSDSTRLYEALGDTAAFGNVRQVIGLLKGITEAFGGRVVKTIGDGLMCAFPEADAAAQAAGEMQKQIAQRPPLESGKKLTIRVGFHYGPVIQDGEDVFGDSVNVAARMAGLALSAQALTDADTVAALSAPLRESTRQINALPVKGKAEEVLVHELMWQVSSDRTVIPGRSEPVSVPGGGPRIKLTHLGKQTTFKDTIYFGREAAGNHVVVADPMASRRHAKIELRAGKFVLVDQSSNGTYVIVGNAAEIRLKREEMILYSSGKFAFGHSTVDAGAEVIAFDCDVK